MSQEEKKDLRLFCAAIECEVWQHIVKAEQDEPGSHCVLRKFCADTCFAYRYNRWLGMANKRIADTSPKERYT